MLASNPPPAALLIFTALFGVLWPFVGLYVRSTNHDLAAWPAVKICFARFWVVIGPWLLTLLAPVALAAVGLFGGKAHICRGSVAGFRRADGHVGRVHVPVAGRHRRRFEPACAAPPPPDATPTRPVPPNPRRSRPNCHHLPRHDMPTRSCRGVTGSDGLSFAAANRQ